MMQARACVYTHTLTHAQIITNKHKREGQILNIAYTIAHMAQSNEPLNPVVYTPMGSHSNHMIHFLEPPCLQILTTGKKNAIC